MLTKKAGGRLAGYDDLLADVMRVIEDARRTATRSVNAVMTTTYWLVGRRIVELEQGGKVRAGYGEALLERLSDDLTARFGRGFSRQNLQQMRQFYLVFPLDQNRQTASGNSQDAPSIRQTSSGKSASALGDTASLAKAFQLPWSHYVRLIGVRNDYARNFYETEALRGGWTVRQLDRREIDVHEWAVLACPGPNQRPRKQSTAARASRAPDPRRWSRRTRWCGTESMRRLQSIDMNKK